VVASRPLPEVPDECPVLVVEDTLAALHAIGNAFYDWPSQHMFTVGVTGTNGKTTTTWLVRSVLEQMAFVVGMVGTIEYALAEDRLDDAGELWVPTERDPTVHRKSSTPYHIAPYRGKYAVPNTTPGPLSMLQLMAGMRDRGAQAAVVEASSHALSQGRLGGTDIDVAVFTNLSQDHLDFHGSMDEYKRSKLGLFRALAAPAGALRAEMTRLEEQLEALGKAEGGAEDAGAGAGAEDARDALEDELAAVSEELADYLGRKRCVVNLDDPYVDEFRAAAGELPVVTFAVNDKDADVVAEKVSKTIWESEMRIRVNYGEKQLRIQVVTPLVGQHNVYNVLAAVATGLALGVPLDAIVKGIEAVEVVPGRMEIIDEGQGFPVVVDYAHTPDALSRLLDTVRECGAKRIITVFGCGGDRDPSKRPLMGEVAHFKSDMVFFTNDNPRSEEPNNIISDIVSGLPSEVKDRHAGSVFPWLQDRIRVPVSPAPAPQPAPPPPPPPGDESMLYEGISLPATVR